MNRKKKIRRHYRPRITPRRENYDILDWASAESQRARFAVLTREIDLAGKSLLDVGSGLGDLWAYLKARHVHVRYTGVDILKDMVRVAERVHPDVRFIQADIFASDPFGDRRFDVVFCSGAMNLNLGNNRAFLPTAAARFLGLARQAAVFNLLHARDAGTDKTYFHHDPDDVAGLLRHLHCAIRIVDNYLPNDFTVICTPRCNPST